MGNKNSSSDQTNGNTKSKISSKSHGQALGGSYHAPQSKSHKDAIARQARANLVTTKSKMKNRSNLQKKQVILNVMEQADAVRQGKTAPPSYDDSHDNTPKKNIKIGKVTSMKPAKKKDPSLYMAKPSSKQALAAEQRMQSKSRSNFSSSGQERKNRTAQLLFGDGLTVTDDTEPKPDTSKRNSPNLSPVNPKTKSKSELNVNRSKQSQAALNRMDIQKSKKLSTNERKNRTMNLVHGDLLTNKTEQDLKNKISSTSAGDENKVDDNLEIVKKQSSRLDSSIDPEVRDVHQCLLNLQNCNSHMQMPATAKLLRKIISNLLRAETREEQIKYGRVRLTQKKIKSTIVDVKYGVETLICLGFDRKELLNEKTNMMDDYLVFDFEHINQKTMWHCIELLDEYYPENL